MVPLFVILPIGEITTAVPVQNTSSADKTSEIEISFSSTLIFKISFAIFITESRVTPGKIAPVNFGVFKILSFIIKIFAEPNSSINDSFSAFKYITSSKPFDLAKFNG